MHMTNICSNSLTLYFCLSVLELNQGILFKVKRGSNRGVGTSEGANRSRNDGKKTW